mmetsp:Transcript_96910/g.202490  ORF Transcript_96910/g.202490 Transcript_96910/m.202490 type:complete len:799 (+) Transcript_96910:168-2564(+)
MRKLELQSNSAETDLLHDIESDAFEGHQWDDSDEYSVSDEFRYPHRRKNKGNTRWAAIAAVSVSLLLAVTCVFSIFGAGHQKKPVHDLAFYAEEAEGGANSSASDADAVVVSDSTTENSKDSNSVSASDSSSQVPATAAEVAEVAEAKSSASSNSNSSEVEEEKGTASEEVEAAPAPAPVPESVDLEPPECSWRGENCTASKCCKDPGMQCYEGPSGWSECRESCTTGPDPTHWDDGNWTCEKVGPRTEGNAMQCAADGEDCSAASCCKTPGFQCYEKSPGYWAQCKADCTVGMDFTDSNPDPWTCKVLGPRAPVAAKWVRETCSQDGMDCRDTQCCANPGSQCFVRDDFWAQCKQDCAPGLDPSQPWSDLEWSCGTLGSRTPPSEPPRKEPVRASWIDNYCSASDENCAVSKCCKDSGYQCYGKASGEAKCKIDCQKGPDLFDNNSIPFTCEEKGPRMFGSARVPPHRNVSDWVATTCGEDNGGCLTSQCCRSQGYQCFKKSDYWAACLESCEPGENRSAQGDIDGNPWSCEKLGPRTPRPWGTPSFFCFSVIRTVGYEADLMRDQMKEKSGIFACDEYAVFSSAPYEGPATNYWAPNTGDNSPNEPMVSLDLGMGPLGPVQTIAFEPTYVGVSQDHTAGNTKLFMRVWDKVLASGKYQSTDWTLKVDPDAVLFPSRLRSQLLPHTGKNTYIVNCDKPGMTPMMFGSVEIFTNAAIKMYFDHKDYCMDNLPWQSWGEDYFMGQCLDKLGVARTNMFNLVSDGVCKGVNCGDPTAAAFHPKKDSASWMACLAQAEAAR